VLTGLWILLVEDDHDTSELYRLALQGAGATVQASNSVEKALGVLESWRPDVVLCDLHLPGIDGYGLIARVRASPSLATIPCISISASHPSLERERSEQAGFAKHLAKPSRIRDIATAIRSLGVTARAGR
jgi:CheY-like chemotaxis protein